MHHESITIGFDNEPVAVVYLLITIIKTNQLPIRIDLGRRKRRDFKLDRDFFISKAMKFSSFINPGIWIERRAHV